MWRILVAIKDGLVLLFLLMFFGALYAALSWSPKPAQSVGSGALLLKLDGTIVEQPSEIDPMALLTGGNDRAKERSEEHTSELKSLMRISSAVFCLKKKTSETRLHLNLRET